MNIVTLKDIADSLGISASTVSLALRNSPRISSLTKEKVNAAALKMGYQANLAGSLLRTTKPNIIGLACNLSQELHFSYYRQIGHLAAELGYQLMTEDTGTSERIFGAISRLKQLRAQAIIMVGEELSVEESALVASTPIIGIGQISPRADADLVTSNNESGLEEVAHLLRGKTDVVYLDGPPSFSANRRKEVFIEKAAEASCDVSIAAAGDTVDDGWNATNRLLAECEEPPQAIVCYNDHCAEGAVLSLLQHQITIPQQVQVVGFDNSGIAKSEAFSLTTVERHASRVSQIALDLAVMRAGGYKEPPARIKVPTRLVRRKTA